PGSPRHGQIGQGDVAQSGSFRRATPALGRPGLSDLASNRGRGAAIMRSGLVPWGERMSSGTRFINLMADRLPPLRWLLGILPSGRGLVILIPYVWLVAFFLIPFIILAKISLSESVTAQPPYTEIVRRVASGQVSFAAPEQTGDAAGATAAAPAAPATTTQTS